MTKWPRWWNRPATFCGAQHWFNGTCYRMAGHKRDHIGWNGFGTRLRWPNLAWDQHKRSRR